MAPKKKGKSKSKAKSGGSSRQLDWASIARDHEDLGDIDNALVWSVIVNVLCAHFDVPDLHTRRGLKKAHSDFPDISKRLNDAYDKSAGDWKIAGGIVAIYARMCTDAILRNKVFGQSYLNKCMSLVDVEPCRHLVLRALSTVTHHGGVEIRTEIAKSTTSKLTDLMAAFPEDRVLNELAVSILTHCVSCLLSDMKRPPSSATLKLLDVPRMLKQVVATLYKPFSTSLILDHAVDLLAQGTLHAPDAYKAVPSALEFLVAGLNSTDWIFRATCVGGIVRRFQREAEPDQRHLDPNKLAAGIKNIPPHLRDITMDYGLFRSDTYLIGSCTAAFTKAMMQVAQDHDILALGRKLVELLQLTEFSIANGAFQSPNARTGRMEFMDIGLPFVMWADALPHCAKALRAAGDLDSADMLDIKYKVMNNKVPEGADLARRALERSPQRAYFQYAISLVANREVGLRACKKGLKCKQTSPFVRFQLLQRAVEHAGDLGIMTLQEAPAAAGAHHDPDGARRSSEGIAFLMSAAEDAKTFVEEAPPDNRHMKSVLYWRILLAFLVRDPPISSSLNEIKPLIRQLKISDDFSEAIYGVPSPKTNMRLAQQAVLRLYPAALEDWGHVITHTGGASSCAVQPENAADDLAAWLDGMSIEDGDGVGEHAHESGHAHAHGDDHEHETHERPEVKKSDLELYRCSYCRNPSAVLRKCAGCSKARYCDAECQKLGWSAHKKTCKASA
ncbi:hypothetical protein BD626DRAFT_411968 [Schizophyllum amplum]|uniref:MYND-type domain-containing protein n=1 Tax=Schizophyllum amplum TaxID=97359 RepID=A0A550BY42_9AGAR|nr:hypothetical protein BD626DRAFT_411968 [Auriculariopsis ampla]